MTTPVLLTCLSLAVLLVADVRTQNPVQIQFQPDPVLVQTGTGIVFTVVTVPQVLSITWQYQGGVTLGLWAGGAAVVNNPPQFLGRVTITATQLQIGNSQLRDAGNYTVTVVPTATTGLTTNSRSIQLSVFDAVAGVTLVVPSVAIEGGNVSLSCTWSAGTGLSVQWGKDGVAITANSRITISGGSLVINPAQRGDAGKYTCTVSNPVSAQTASQTLTVYYGPDTPVLTKQTPNPNGCVGGGDVLVGQTVGLTCTSNSLPPALYSWQYNGQPVTSSQSASGVLTLQTYSTNQSGQYFCIAKNSVTGNTSTQGTDLAIVGVCLSVGQVVGIVIGSLLLIIIIVLLIVLIVFFARRRRAPPRERQTVVVQKTNPQTTPPDPQPNGARELGQGPNPPLYHSDTHTRQPDRLYTTPHGRGGNPQMQQLNGEHNSNTHQHNGRTHTNGLLRNAFQATNSYPHNGIDNPAFMHTDVHNANALPNTQQQNPNILIQAGTAQGGTQLPAVHVNLNALPQTAQQNNNAQMPTIHLNLNSYPTNSQTQQDSSFPPTNTADNRASQTQLNTTNTQQSNPGRHGGQSYPSDHRLTGHIDTAYQHQPGLIPTGYTHSNSNNTSQRNANTQTYQQETHRSRSNRTSGRHDATSRSSRQQMSWDLLRGTPSYPSGTFQSGHISPEDISDATDYSNTDYTIHPPIREARVPNRSQPRPRTQTPSRSRAPTRQDGLLVNRRSRSADFLNVNALSVTELETPHHVQRNHRTQRESAQQGIRGLLGSQTAPRQETTRSNNPQALPLMSQQASVDRSAVSQGPTTQQGVTSPRGTDTRALADPNHLPQAHMAQQHRAAHIQTSPQGLGTQTQPVIDDARQPLQGGTVPIPQPSAQPNPSNLTQAALKAHTETARTFQNRKQQTQAALLHPGPQARAPVADVQYPPTPPPAIPLEQFQTLPERSHHSSPARGPQPSRPPANIPVAQRPPKHRLNVQHHPVMMAATNHHHPGKGHMHISENKHPHAPGHGHPAHFTHPRQQQAHRGRPR